jgi:hypothetical protein
MAHGGREDGVGGGGAASYSGLGGVSRGHRACSERAAATAREAAVAAQEAAAVVVALRMEAGIA